MRQDFDYQSRQQQSEQWPGKAYDWSDSHTVPVKPSLLSPFIVVAGTLLAAGAPATACLVTQYHEELRAAVPMILETPYVFLLK